MRIRYNPLLNIFSDKSSLVLRALLREPKRKWKVLDLVDEGLSLGQIVNVLEFLHQSGWVYRHYAGRSSFTEVKKAKEILKSWSSTYKFFWNPQVLYYTEKSNSFLKELKPFLENQNIPFALTLYSATRLIVPYVIDQNQYLYLGVRPEEIDNVLRQIEKRFSLKRLRSGGNVLFSIPYYKSSVFHDKQIINGFPVVSYLQLYLDLMGFPPSGWEQAESLLKYLKERRIPLV